MAFEEFVPKNFSTAHQWVIREANKIITEYQAAGYRLTLRQIYYQFVARDMLQNKQTEYKRLGGIIDAARKAGMIDWDAIEDRTRNLRRINVWQKPEDAVKTLSTQFKRDPWDEQTIRRRIEVWIEKDALVGVIQPTCNEFRLPYFSCRGYGSSSELYDAGKRLAMYHNAGYETLILHLGDHDPSGVQMTEDNTKRLSLFAGFPVELRRLALNMDQIEQYRPPANFAKEADARTKWYIEQFDTDDCWELDALGPDVMAGLIRSAVEPLIDQEEWTATMEQEQDDLSVLTEIISDWKRTKAAPDMLDKLREFATEYSVDGEANDEGDFDNADSAFAALVIDESTEVLQRHDLL